jgi:hypothetical protein
MRALKALVIGMGVLIVAGIVVLVYAIVDKAGAPETASFAPAEIVIPKGAAVAETALGDGRIALRLRLADGSGRLILIDAATGRVTGTMELKKQP